MSDNLRSGDCALSKDISGAVDVIEATSKAAHQSRKDIHNGKKRRIENSGGQSFSLDHDVGPSIQRASNTSINRYRGLTSGTPTDGNTQPSLDHPSNVSTRRLAVLNAIVPPGSSEVSPDNGSANRTTNDAAAIRLPFEKSDVSSLVHLLKLVEDFLCYTSH
jgi:hypothetical protein